jgi:hypothetical protein
MPWSAWLTKQSKVCLELEVWPQQPVELRKQPQRQSLEKSAECWPRNPWPKWLVEQVLEQQGRPCEKPVELQPVKSQPVCWVEWLVAQQRPGQWPQHAYQLQPQQFSPSLKKLVVVACLF